MKVLFKILFTFGLLAVMVFVSHKHLVNSDTQVGRQLNQFFDDLQKTDASRIEPASGIQNDNALNKEEYITEPAVQEPAVRKQMNLYRWKDEYGRTQITDTPPEDREYKTITYQEPKNLPKVSPRPTLKPNFNTQQKQPSNQNQQQFTKPTPLPVQCQVKMRDVHRLEKKLDKASDVTNSIWLQDYCSALSELIQDNCVVPKKEIKYNRYCPVRFKR